MAEITTTLKTACFFLCTITISAEFTMIEELAKFLAIGGNPTEY